MASVQLKYMSVGDTTDKGEEGELKRIPLDQLEIDYRYQRPPSKKKVEAMAKAYDERAAQSLSVSVRDDGTFAVFDGQTRVLACRKLGRFDHLCSLWRDMTLQEEAAEFAKINKLRTNPSAAQTWNAKLVAHDYGATQVYEALRKAGVHVASSRDQTGRHRPKNAVWCMGTIEGIYRVSGADAITYIVGVARNLWPESPRALDASILDGLHLFWRTYQKTGKLERDWYRKLERVSPEELLRQTLSSNIVTGMTSRRVAVARAILALYNSGRRTSHLDDLLYGAAASIRRKENEEQAS